MAFLITFFNSQPIKPVGLVTKLLPCNSLRLLSSADFVEKYEADFIVLYKFTEGPQVAPMEDIPHLSDVPPLLLIPSI